MEKTIKLCASPKEAPIEEACGIIMSLHLPYDKTMVTILVNPNTTDYDAGSKNENITVKHIMVNEFTKNTKILTFDTKNNSVKHQIDDVTILLTAIDGKRFKEYGNQIFLEYTFLVRTIES